MHQLSSDKSFHFELLRVLAAARGYGADVAEVLLACDKLVPGDFESWHLAFKELAEWVETTIDEDVYDKVSLRDAYWRASRYHFASGFFLQKESEDSRASEIVHRWQALFDQGCRQMRVPPSRQTLQADGFQVPTMFFPCSTDDVPRPVVIIGNGLDGSMEEMIHTNGFQALERGYHVLLYEGPGQPSVRRGQGIGFIHDWERTVKPVVDYLQSLPSVDHKKITLLGNSLGGYLAARAAAFEPRIAAVILIDGIYDVGEGIGNLFGPDVTKFDQSGDEEGFNNALVPLMEKSSNIRFLVNQISWAFMLNPYQAFQVLKKMNLRGIEEKIQCYAFVAGAENDIFDAIDQPGATTKALAHLGDKLVLKRFTAQEASDAHCHVGAAAFSNQIIYSWLGKQLGVENQSNYI